MATVQYQQTPGRRPPQKKKKKGPSNRTRRIITVSVLALLLILVIALIAHAIGSHRDKKAEEAEDWIDTATSITQTVPETTEETLTAAQTSNYFSDLKEGYNLPYCIAVNTAQNVVTVYSKDPATGTYTRPVRAFICSTGLNGATRSGTWYTSEKCGQWHSLQGGVQGQWATRIHSGILFHSVPYNTANKGDLEDGEFNKLGSNASAGCVRLCVRDVKWIYDNCPMGTCVTIYNDSTVREPLGKPSIQKITVSAKDARHGWDPTDPDPANPWRT